MSEGQEKPNLFFFNLTKRLQYLMPFRTTHSRQLMSPVALGVATASPGKNDVALRHTIF